MSKERNSIASSSTSKEIKDVTNEKYKGGQNNSTNAGGGGSKLQDLKRNMYKNKATIEWKT